MTQFVPFPKVPRLSREMVITEKLDGTNASVWIEKTDPNACLSVGFRPPEAEITIVQVGDDYYSIRAGSRKRFVMPNTDGVTTDNFGFAAWVRDNAEELVKLGEGTHYGEWWGQGIQRKYDLDEKRFSLFNVGRWRPKDDEPRFPGETWWVPPSCCHIVPVLYTGPFDALVERKGEIVTTAEDTLAWLADYGSVAAPGYDNPEGIMIYHTAANQVFKKTFEGDEKGKGQ